jgi:hypothetical protein
VTGTMDFYDFPYVGNHRPIPTSQAMPTPPMWPGTVAVVSVGEM